MNPRTYFDKLNMTSRAAIQSLSKIGLALKKSEWSLQLKIK